MIKINDASASETVWRRVGYAVPVETTVNPMRLGKRLAAVASLIPEGAVVADIGTDHAYLPVYLVMQKTSPRVIAIEKSPQNCQRARETVNLFNLGEKIEVRCGDGLSALQEEDRVDLVVIAGLGGKTICRLLMTAGEKLERYRRLVLQPMGDASLLRRWLLARGFALAEERLALERGFFYEVMAVEKGCTYVADPIYYELGPGLMEAKDPLLIPWLQQKIKNSRHVLDGLGKRAKGPRDGRYLYFLARHKKMEEVLRHVCHGQ